jgi:hypothetical protein
MMLARREGIQANFRANLLEDPDQPEKGDKVVRNKLAV